jgi:hypothetical protein
MRMPKSFLDISWASASAEVMMARRWAMYLRFSIGLLFALCYSAEMTNGQGSYSEHAIISESGATIRLVANDARPLMQALTALQQKYGWRVNYEDPQYISQLDLVEAKGLQDKSFYPNGQHRVPSGGSFVVEFGAGSAANIAPDEKKTLQQLVDSYNRSGNPGRFEFREGRPEQIFDVVGTAAHDNQGRISQQQVLLDLPVTLDSEDRTFSDTVDLICQKIAEKSHAKITFGVHPLSLDRAHVTVGGKDLSARSYLFRSMESTNRKLYWRLLFDPDSNSYFLNVHQVAPVIKSPAAK